MTGTVNAVAQQKDSLDAQIGQMIMIGVGDRTAISETDPLLEDIRSGKVGGVVLFEKNIAKTNSRDSMIRMVQTLKEASPVKLLVSIDEEGGKVHRLKEKYGFPAMPSADYLGHLDQKDSTLWYNRRLIATLKDLGINLNYAPDVDLATNPDNAPIVKNGRSFGSDPELVARQARYCIEAHHESGLLTSLKHFPGHGSSKGDTHYGIVDVTETWSVSELLPYERLLREGDIDIVMVGHMVNRRWDTTMLPATLSAATITMLRTLMGYKGVVCSDDMQMQAISEHYGLENAIQLCVNAGLDIIMFANTLPDRSKYVTAAQVHAIIKKAVLNGTIPRARIAEASRRIKALKEKY
ncbi:glycoside hydrolase family 3 protein [Rurimicrobium arvi]|uniref:beta-N-acetylhexosaminidase n=2 Tax=Rurimicrobium arvi TaxID=2049916 RepID=A0ABP8MXH2_9BACT